MLHCILERASGHLICPEIDCMHTRVARNGTALSESNHARLSQKDIISADHISKFQTLVKIRGHRAGPASIIVHQQGALPHSLVSRGREVSNNHEGAPRRRRIRNLDLGVPASFRSSAGRAYQGSLVACGCSDRKPAPADREASIRRQRSSLPRNASTPTGRKPAPRLQIFARGADWQPTRTPNTGLRYGSTRNT